MEKQTKEVNMDKFENKFIGFEEQKIKRRYELLSVLGKGAFGKVVKARDKESD